MSTDNTNLGPQTKQEWYTLLLMDPQGFSAWLDLWRTNNPGSRLDMTQLMVFNVDIFDLDLSYVDWSGSWFSNCMWRNCNCSHSLFINARFGMADAADLEWKGDFEYVDRRVFHYASTLDAFGGDEDAVEITYEVDVSWSQFDFSDFSGSTFIGLIMRSVVARDACFDNCLLLTDAGESESCFDGSNLEGSTWRNVCFGPTMEFRHVNFDGANFDGADFGDFLTGYLWDDSSGGDIFHRSTFRGAQLDKILMEETGDYQAFNGSWVHSFALYHDVRDARLNDKLGLVEPVEAEEE